MIRMAALNPALLKLPHQSSLTPSYLNSLLDLACHSPPNGPLRVTMCLPIPLDFSLKVYGEPGLTSS